MRIAPKELTGLVLLHSALAVGLASCANAKGGDAGSGGSSSTGGITVIRTNASSTGGIRGTGGLTLGGSPDAGQDGEPDTGGVPRTGGSTGAARGGTLGNTGGTGGSTGHDGGPGSAGNARTGGSSGTGGNSGTGGSTGTGGLVSAFLRDDDCARAVLSGRPYEMRDPQWRIGSDINRDTCAFKFLAALNMLGYNTETGRYAGGSDYDEEPTNVLAKFQGKHALPVTSLLHRDALLVLDRQLAEIEPVQAAAGAGFPLRDHMQVLHKHDISADAVAAIYHLPMSVLPASLHMDAYETLQCVGFQCNGFIHDRSGSDIPTPVDPAADWFFAAAYYDNTKDIFRYPSAAVHAQTVLHEFAHYLDKLIRSPLSNQPHSYSLDTTAFYQLGFVLATATPTRVSCAQRRSDDPLDYVSRYGFQSSYDCAEGLYRPCEEFAEAFSLYVVAGRHFRAAAAKRATVQAEYDWLMHNVFEGIEYDTFNPVGTNVGCNDVPGLEDKQPGYFSCSEDAVWNWTLPVLAASSIRQDHR